MSRYTGCEWTPAEDAILRRLYPLGGPAACAEYLPHRTEAAMRHRANLIGVGFRTGRRVTAKAYADPPPEEIDRMTREIRAGWSSEEMSRR